MEKENDSESVEILRQGLLEVLDCGNRLEHNCSAVQTISNSFEPTSEPTDFNTLLDESTRQALAASNSDPANHPFFQQFNQAVWKIHHAGEAAPGQEQEEFVMITSETGVLNQTCPLSGKPVISLEDPVRSRECHHIYDQVTVLDYIRTHGRRRRKCPVTGCPKFLEKEHLSCDTALKMEIQELRLRLRATQTQVADYTTLEDDQTFE